MRRTMRANPPGGRLRILATGDSMIQIVDSYLRERVDSRRALVRSDARVSTGLSKPALLDWRAHCARAGAGIRPDVTVMFIGANDGFRMAGADCCGAPWIAEYARRARQHDAHLRARRPRAGLLAAAAGGARAPVPRDVLRP